MHQRTATGRDIHDERLVRVRIIAIGRRGFLAEQLARVLLVRSRVLEEADV